MAIYEFIPKEEYREPRECFEYIIKTAQRFLREGVTHYGRELLNKYTFTFHLIGSAAVKFVTRRKGTNDTFDFDYDLEIQRYSLPINEYDIQNDFYIAFSDACNNFTDEYSNEGFKAYLKEKKRVITVVVKSYNRTTYFADIAILKKEDEDLKILVREIDGRCHWNQTKNFNDVKEKLSDNEFRRFFRLVKEKYLDLKSKEENMTKKSYSIFHEAINNVYHEQIRNISNKR